MRIARAVFGGRTAPAIAHAGHWLDVAACGTVGKDADVIAVLNRPDELREVVETLDVEALVASGQAVAEGEAVLRKPLDGPRSIVAVGLNYLAHAREVQVVWEAPPTPLLFAKWPSSLSGPFDDIPVDSSLTTQVDYEVELAAVIGQTAQSVSVEDALRHVAGYAVANDISARDIQSAESQWTRAKSFDGFCPVGPWITSSDEVPDPQDLTLSCSVNGSVRQDASTAQMIHSVAELIAYVSRGTTLHPGDLILTGTPSGVAMAMPEPEWLADGDVVRSEVHGLGHLENRVTVHAGRR